MLNNLHTYPVYVSKPYKIEICFSQIEKFAANHTAGDVDRTEIQAYVYLTSRPL